MKLEVNEEQLQLIIDSLYYANCRLGNVPKLAGGKYTDQARWLELTLKHQLKKERKSTEPPEE